MPSESQRLPALVKSNTFSVLFCPQHAEFHKCPTENVTAFKKFLTRTSGYNPYLFGGHMDSDAADWLLNDLSGELSARGYDAFWDEIDDVASDALDRLDDYLCERERENEEDYDDDPFDDM